jgi:16S rRNA processing protein RimM
MTSASPDLVFVAAIAGAHGVKGEAKVKSFTGDPEAAFDYGPFLDIAGKPLLTPKSWRAVKDGFVVRFAEPLSREDAQTLKSTKLYIPRSALPALEEDEFYHSDLIGLTLESLTGEPMGKLRAIHDYGGGDLLEIMDTPGRKGGWFLPFTRENAPHVDLAKGVIVIDPPEEVESGEKRP